MTPAIECRELSFAYNAEHPILRDISFVVQEGDRVALVGASGAGILRVFLAWPGATLALQNHKPIINNYRQMLQMIQEVCSPHLKACLDAPILERKDPDYARLAVEYMRQVIAQARSAVS